MKKPESLCSQAWMELPRFSLVGSICRQLVLVPSWNTGRLAHRLLRHAGQGVAGCKGRSRTARRAGDRALQIAGNAREGDGRTGGLLRLKSPLLGSAINLAQVIDASIHLGLCTSPDEVGDRDGG